MFRIALALIVALSLSSPGFASEDSKPNSTPAFGEELTASQRQMLTRDIEAFFKSPGAQTIEPIRQWRPTFQSIEYFLNYMRGKLDQDGLSPLVWRLGGPLLLIVAGKVENNPKYLAPIPRERVHLYLKPLLKRYAAEPEILEPVVRIYDHYDLWGYGDFWFVKENLASRQDLEVIWPRVRALMAITNKTETRQLIKLLRQNYQDKLMALYLVVNAEQRLASDLSTEAEKDLSRLFLGTYQEFCSALVESRKMIAGALRRHRSGERFTFIHEELSAFMEFYKIQHPGVMAAFETARAQATWVARRDHFHNDGLLFFDLFASGKLDWQDPRTWSLNSVDSGPSSDSNVGSSAVNPAQLPEMKVSEERGVVIKVDFTAKRCAAQLTSDDPIQPKN